MKYKLLALEQEEAGEFKMSIQLIVKIAQETPQKQAKPEYKEPNIYEKVKQAIECFECDVDRDEAWSYILRVNNFIMLKDSPTPKELRVLKMILPLIDKHGQQGSPSAITSISKLKMWGLK